MRTIQAQVNITSDHRLNVQLPEDIEAGQYQVVIVMNPELNPDDCPEEIVVEGIKEGLEQAIRGQTVPLSQMWEGIDAE
jgi:hypothetical protein